MDKKHDVNNETDKAQVDQEVAIRNVRCRQLVDATRFSVI